jgi:hypothetical protein
VKTDVLLIESNLPERMEPFEGRSGDEAARVTVGNALGILRL